MSDLAEYLEDMQTGVAVAMAALVISLDAKGVVSKQDYAEALTDLWGQLPDEAAVGGAGAVIEPLLDILAANHSASPNEASEATLGERSLLQVLLAKSPAQAPDVADTPGSRAA